MTLDTWNSSRCNFEAPGTGLTNAADWFGVMSMRQAASLIRALS